MPLAINHWQPFPCNQPLAPAINPDAWCVSCWLIVVYKKHPSGFGEVISVIGCNSAMYVSRILYRPEKRSYKWRHHHDINETSNIRWATQGTPASVNLNLVSSYQAHWGTHQREAPNPSRTCLRPDGGQDPPLHCQECQPRCWTRTHQHLTARQQGSLRERRDKWGREAEWVGFENIFHILRE